MTVPFRVDAEARPIFADGNLRLWLVRLARRTVTVGLFVNGTSVTRYEVHAQYPGKERHSYNAVPPEGTVIRNDREAMETAEVLAARHVRLFLRESRDPGELELLDVLPKVEAPA